MRNVSKIYKLHTSPRDQLIDVLGLQRIGIRPRGVTKEFAALTDISLQVPRGHRIGIVGRNGAGKTTLLKLVCGNFSPTHGEVEIHGTVQALMTTGLGFHPEYTGRENVEAALQYSGLERSDYRKAVEGIIEFCELGDFFDQPFRTYSLGMQARLMFAVATAIRPDILIVDEVLGAGDARFVSKSKTRVAKLVSSGCTMLLVSHSMQQVLELCDEAIWLDQGRIRMRDRAFLVVKAYEQYMHGTDQQTLASPIMAPIKSTGPDGDPERGETGASESAPKVAVQRTAEEMAELLMQVPRFMPHAQIPPLPAVTAPAALKFVAAGGISRWESDPGLKLIGFTIATERGETNKLISMKPVKFVLSVLAEFECDFTCRYGIVFLDYMGASIAKLVSPLDGFSLKEGGIHAVEMILNPLQLGPGDYIVSVSIHQSGIIEQFSSTPRYDLVSRSFCFTVEMPESIFPLSAQFLHTAEWLFQARN